jgi:hypothetical protein
MPISSTSRRRGQRDELGAGRGLRRRASFFHRQSTGHPRTGDQWHPRAGGVNRVPRVVVLADPYLVHSPERGGVTNSGATDWPPSRSASASFLGALVTRGRVASGTRYTVAGTAGCHWSDAQSAERPASAPTMDQRPPEYSHAGRPKTRGGVSSRPRVLLPSTEHWSPEDRWPVAPGPTTAPARRRTKSGATGRTRSRRSGRPVLLRLTSDPRNICHAGRPRTRVGEDAGPWHLLRSVPPSQLGRGCGCPDGRRRGRRGLRQAGE